MVTTAIYLKRSSGREDQDAAVDFILNNFTIVPCDNLPGTYLA